MPAVQPVVLQATSAVVRLAALAAVLLIHLRAAVRIAVGVTLMTVLETAFPSVRRTVIRFVLSADRSVQAWLPGFVRHVLVEPKEKEEPRLLPYW